MTTTTDEKLAPGWYATCLKCRHQTNIPRRARSGGFAWGKVSLAYCKACSWLWLHQIWKQKDDG